MLGLLVVFSFLAATAFASRGSSSETDSMEIDEDGAAPTPFNSAEDDQPPQWIGGGIGMIPGRVLLPQRGGRIDWGNFLSSRNSADHEDKYKDRAPTY
jgi:hypothetical protein